MEEILRMVGLTGANRALEIKWYGCFEAMEAGQKRERILLIQQNPPTGFGGVAVPDGVECL